MKTAFLFNGQGSGLTQQEQIDRDLADFDAFGEKPMIAAGHSLGETAALIAAQSLDRETGRRLIEERVSAVDRFATGGMAVLAGQPIDALKSFVEDRHDQLWAANENSAEQLTVAGTDDALERTKEAAKKEKIVFLRLPIKGAFHCPLMGRAATEFYRFTKTLSFRDPAFPIISCTTGYLPDAADLGEYLALMMVSPVLWLDTQRALCAAGIDSFKEVGGTALGAMMKSFNSKIRKV